MVRALIMILVVLEVSYLAAYFIEGKEAATSYFATGAWYVALTVSASVITYFSYDFLRLRISRFMEQNVLLYNDVRSHQPIPVFKSVRKGGSNAP